MPTLQKKEKPKKLRIIFEKAKNLTPDQKKGILDVKARVLGVSSAPASIPVSAYTVEIPKPEPKLDIKKEVKIEKSATLQARDISGPEIEDALNKGLEDVYAKKGVMGIGKVSGKDTKEWELMRKLNADAVLGYYTGDSSASSLPSNITSALSKSEEHYRLVEELKELMDQIAGGVKPYENENVEAFLKRLITLALKSQQK